MAEDDSFGVVMQASQSDESRAHFMIPISSARHGVLLGIDVDCGCRVAHQDTFGDPFFELAGCSGVDVALGSVAKRGFALFDSDEVIRAPRGILFLHLGRDLVVGLRENFFQVYPGGVEAIGAERENFCHGAIVAARGRAEACLPADRREGDGFSIW